MLNTNENADVASRTMASSGPALKAVGISKSYGNALVLDGVGLDLQPGEIHALCGENGAGKSTLVNILCGVVRPDAGSMLVGGSEVTPSGPTHARSLGISVIHQHPVLFPDLTIAENISLANPLKSKGSWVQHKKARVDAAAVLHRLGVDLDPRRSASSLAIADQQMVEIAKAIMQEPTVLILDEPTASLTPHEVNRLFTILRDLRAHGTALMMVNHRMSEIFAIADKITVLRNGRCIDTSPTVETTADRTITRMVGRHIPPRIPNDARQGETALETVGLTRRGVFHDVNLMVHSGEVLGLAGLIGAGRTDIGRAAFGLDPVDAGEIRVGGIRLDPATPRQAIAAGMAFVPEDRHGQGLAMDASITDNLLVTSLATVSTRSWVRRTRERLIARELIARFRVICRGPGEVVSNLSGGNQQKIVLARWLATNPRVLILDEPTFGVDVGAQREIHDLIRELASGGVAVLLISSDLIELLALSDRILVVREGRIVESLSGSAMSEVAIMSAAVGAAA